MYRCVEFIWHFYRSFVYILANDFFFFSHSMLTLWADCWIDLFFSPPKFLLNEMPTLNLNLFHLLSLDNLIHFYWRHHIFIESIVKFLNWENFGSWKRNTPNENRLMKKCHSHTALEMHTHTRPHPSWYMCERETSRRLYQYLSIILRDFATMKITSQPSCT